VLIQNAKGGQGIDEAGSRKSAFTQRPEEAQAEIEEKPQAGCQQGVSAGQKRRMENSSAAGSVFRNRIVCHDLLFLSVFEKISGLAVQRFAQSFQGAEADGFCLAGLENREIRLGDADLIRQILGADLAPRHHHIKIDENGHGYTV